MKFCPLGVTQLLLIGSHSSCGYKIEQVTFPTWRRKRMKVIILAEYLLAGDDSSERKSHLAG